MSYLWLLPATRRPAQAVAWAAATELSGAPAGGLAALPRDARRGPSAGKVDARAISPDGAAAFVSLVWAPAGVYLPFDDVAVTGAIRRSLAGPAFPVVSALSQSDDRFVGALTAVFPADAAAADPAAAAADPAAAVSALADDPFAALFPRRLLRIEAGLLARMPAPVGPSSQRYGAGSPWDRFPRA